MSGDVQRLQGDIIVIVDKIGCGHVVQDWLG